MKYISLMFIFSKYRWGWDLRLPFGWWLTWSCCDNTKKLYLSPDATSSNERTKMLFVSK